MRKMHPVWTLVVCAGAMLAINMGIRQTFGLYLKPISQSLNLDRESFSLAMAVLNLVWGLGAPFAGALSDRLGAVRVALAGTAFYVLGLVLMATAAGANQLMFAGVLIGLGISGSGFTAVFGLIARAAPPERRASALGMTTMGSAIGQFVSLPYTHVILDATGWVTSLFVMAGTAALMAPLALALARAETAEPHLGARSGSAWAAQSRKALKYPSFLLLTAGFFVCGFHIAAIAVHLPAYLADKGFGPALGSCADGCRRRKYPRHLFLRLDRRSRPEALGASILLSGAGRNFPRADLFAADRNERPYLLVHSRRALARYGSLDERADRDLLRAALAVHALRNRVFLPSGWQLHGRVARRLAVRHVQVLRSLVVGVDSRGGACGRTDICR